jgi:hypothetical protein
MLAIPQRRQCLHAMPDGAMCCRCAAKIWQSLGFYQFALPGGVKNEPGTYFRRTATIADSTLDHYFKEGVAHNIGYRLGLTPTHNRVLIDVDTKPIPGAAAGACQNGLTTVIAASQYPDFKTLIKETDALVVKTPSGGFHLIYDAGDVEYSQSPKLWRDVYGNDCGIDIRARNGYALAPGSWLRVNPTRSPRRSLLCRARPGQLSYLREERATRLLHSLSAATGLHRKAATGVLPQPPSARRARGSQTAAVDADDPHRGHCHPLWRD